MGFRCCWARWRRGERAGRRRPRQRRAQSPRLLQCRRRRLPAMWLSRGPPTARVPKHSRGVATVASVVCANSSPSAAAHSTLETTIARVLPPRRGVCSQHTTSIVIDPRACAWSWPLIVCICPIRKTPHLGGGWTLALPSSHCTPRLENPLDHFTRFACFLYCYRRSLQFFNR